MIGGVSLLKRSIGLVAVLSLPGAVAGFYFVPIFADVSG